MIQLGIENLLKNKKLTKQLLGKRVALVAHPASVDKNLVHSIDLLSKNLKGGLSCAFGPQHGMRGEKQDNMIESDDFIDPIHKIPIFSLYGTVRRPTPKMLDHFDIALFDLQDVGCRIYTFLTTLFYMMEDCARTGKAIWVLDRPNSAGRPFEGNYLEKKFFSFVGGAEIPMRHGLTLGEAGLWYKNKMNLNIDFQVIKMTGYNPDKAPNYGWPQGEMPWVNPSPNMPRLSTARSYAGTVLIEGTRLSEGRGTTIPLEVIAAPGIDGEELVKRMHKMIPQYLKKGVRLRPCFFEPTFQKHAKTLCSGFQIHIDQKDYNHAAYKPYRIVAAALKCIREMQPDFDMWLPPPYEYEKINMPIDILSGNSKLREWVDDKSAKWKDYDSWLTANEKPWAKERKPFLLY